ncbi:MAG TPA: lipopolysaccharide assembly protein LapB [Thiobacillaceae bacterium]|nr:lipopolysaccharide assembly protein LapB [Thiobacillaceae bacterium]
MEIETWHLLVLPLFFVIGWLAARVDIRHLMKESRAIPASYFKGLNFLLNEQPDKAIEAFLEVAKLDPDTLELHFALGALFRRRGELDRAIRIHQNLVDRSDLNQEHRQKALFELGQDFFKAGLLDRAEDIFKRLETGIHALEALRLLRDIYVLEKDWDLAIATVKRLDKLGSPSGHSDQAHYHCERAVNALLAADESAVRDHLQQALQVNRKSVRALQLLGDLEARAGHDEQAIKAWREIEQVNPAYLPIVAERIFQAYRRLDRSREGIQLLQGYLARQPSADLFHILFNAMVESEGWSAARLASGEELKRNPNLRVLDDYLQARTAASEAESDLEIRMAQDLIHNQVGRMAHYRCERCGFKSGQFFWQCPACAVWESIPPERVMHD